MTNDGNVTLYDVSLVDDNGTPDIISDDVLIDLSGLTDEDGDGDFDDLAVGNTATASYLYTITDADVAAAQHITVVQIQGLDVDIQYDADASRRGVDWQLLDLSDSTLKIWVDSDVDPFTGQDLGGIDGVIDIDLGTAGPPLENTERLSISEGEEFDFALIAVDFQEDINILFELSLGQAALDQLASADDSLRVTSEVYIGGRDEPGARGTPLAYHYTEDFDFDSLL